MKAVLLFSSFSCIMIDDIFHDIGNIAQPGERPPDAREVMGSSPIVSRKESRNPMRIPVFFYSSVRPTAFRLLCRIPFMYAIAMP